MLFKYVISLSSSASLTFPRLNRRRVRDNGQTGYHYDQALFNFDLKAGTFLREGGRKGGREGERELFSSFRICSRTSFAPFHARFRTDLSPAFDWNIKQLFVFLVVEYESKMNVRTLPSLPPSFSLLQNFNFHAPSLLPPSLPPSLYQVLSQVVVWDRIIERKKTPFWT